MSINRKELRAQLKNITATLKEDRKACCQKMSAKITKGDQPWNGMTAREISEELGATGQEIGAWVRDSKVDGVTMRTGTRIKYFMECDADGKPLGKAPVKIKQTVHVYRPKK